MPKSSTTNQARDTIFKRQIEKISDFQFDDQIAGVFTDMIRRSVPGYDTVIKQIGIFTAQYARPGCNCYDLGCSLGAATLAMRRAIPHNSGRIFGIDNSPAMLRRCRSFIIADNSYTLVHLICANIQDIKLENASVVVLNYTLQFIDPLERLDMLSKIYKGLNPGGILILSEKIAFADAGLQKFHTDLYHAFKRANGYSEQEVSQKRTALENILIPDTLEKHHERLKNAGFHKSEVWFRCFNFASIAAFKK